MFQSQPADSPIGYPSLLAHLAVDSLNNPPIILTLLANSSRFPQHQLQPLDGSTVPCDLRLLNVRSLNYTSDMSALWVWHRVGVDCSLDQTHTRCQLGKAKVRQSRFSLLMFLLQRLD